MTPAPTYAEALCSGRVTVSIKPTGDGVRVTAKATHHEVIDVGRTSMLVTKAEIESDDEAVSKAVKSQAMKAYEGVLAALWGARGYIA